MLLLALLAALPGCMSDPCGRNPGPEPLALPAAHANPLFVSCTQHEYLWENVVDVIHDDFRVAYEQPVRIFGDTILEGRLETLPEVGSTLFEPWRHDSASPYQKLYATLQSIRRQVSVRVSPAQGGYWIEVVAHRELENLSRPMMSTSGLATFGYDGGLERVTERPAVVDVPSCWIDDGRDVDLEQRLLGHLVARFSGVGVPVTIQSSGK